MAASVFVNELLNFATFYVKRVSKAHLCDAITSFYHEDELSTAKLHLSEAAADSGQTIDGWSKFINNKGVPIHRKGDGVVRRAAEADDIVSMIAVLDANGVRLPTYASVDLSRIPPPLISAANNNTAMSDVAKALEGFAKRLDALEEGWRTSPVVPAVQPVNCAARQSVVASPVLSSDGAPQPAYMPATVMPAMGRLQVHMDQNKQSWAGAAISGNVPDFVNAVKQANKSVVRVGTNTNNSVKVKAVPRELACFVGRLDASTTAEDLHEYLTAKGMKGVYCRKLEPKNGRVFKTAAFKVTCCVESRHLFLDESCWPGGAELRDWVYYPRGDTNTTNGGQ